MLCPGAGIIYAIVSASQQSSSAQLSALSHGPGDNSECEHYNDSCYEEGLRRSLRELHHADGGVAADRPGQPPDRGPALRHGAAGDQGVSSSPV